MVHSVIESLAIISAPATQSQVRYPLPAPAKASSQGLAARMSTRVIQWQTVTVLYKYTCFSFPRLFTSYL